MIIYPPIIKTNYYPIKIPSDGRLLFSPVLG